jgi:PAS domain-containing protein
MKNDASVHADHKFPAFLDGDGEMSRLVREYDWASSALGPVATWPQSLCTTLGIMLKSKFPMFLFWGEAHICFYNDAYRPSLGVDGRHPAIGKEGADVWADIWHVIGPHIDQVLSGGEAVWFEDALVPFFRNGKIEDIYWTYSYSAVYGDGDKPVGALVVCVETTTAVMDRKTLEETNDQLHFAIETTELATWDLNVRTSKFSGNERLREWFGFPPDDEIGLEDAFHAVAEADRPRIMAALERALQYESGGLYEME